MSYRRCFQSFFRLTTHKVWRKCPRGLTTGAGILLAAPPIVNKENKAAQLQPPDASQLNSKTLIRNASVLTIDSSTALVTQTTTALLEVEEKYVETLLTILKLMELNLEVLGNQYREERAQDAILHFRQELNQLKEQKQELEIIFNCTEKVMTSAAEAAFIAGAEYAATAATERLNSAKFQLELSRKRIQDVENSYHQMEANTIAATAKHHEKEKKKEKEKEKCNEASDATLSDLETAQDANVDFKTLGLPTGGIPGETKTGSDAELIIAETLGREFPAEKGFPEDEQFPPDKGYSQEFQPEEQPAPDVYTAEYSMDSAPGIKIYGIPKGGLPGRHSNKDDR